MGSATTCMYSTLKESELHVYRGVLTERYMYACSFRYFALFTFLAETGSVIFR